MAEAFPEEFLEFCALFNRGVYFEAHEVLEDLWRTDRQDFYKGLIQQAVGLLHLENGNLVGARHLFETSGELLKPYLPTHRGLDLARLRHETCCIVQRLPDARRISLEEVAQLGLPRVQLHLSNDAEGAMLRSAAPRGTFDEPAGS
ncbi:MAG: DUF309 domain-containing protein [Firmicutes bacterium]|nr:DUF309 domain-containing protein [Bacillota bacterium]